MNNNNVFVKSESINQGIRRNSPFLTPNYSKGIIRSKLILVLQFVALFSLLLVGLPAKAADYTLSDASANLPPGFVIVSPGNYSCGALTLGPNDTISIGGTTPATITFIGAFTTGVSNLINEAGLASDLTFVTTGTLTLGAETIMNANVSGTAAVNLGIGSILGGNLTTASPAGVVTLAANSRVAGYIHTDDGAVTVGDLGSVGGEITAEAGAVTLGADVKIDGDIRTIAGAITMSDGGSTCGSVITTGAGVITLLTNVKIGGSISSIAGAIGVGRGSTIGGDVGPAGAGVVTLVGVDVGGRVTTVDGAITLTDSRVGGAVEASGAGVVTIINSTVGDLDLVVPPSPACLSQSSATVTLSNLMQTYTGNPITPTATTWPEGLTVDFTYNGSATPPTHAGSYEVVGTINDLIYAGSASGTLVISDGGDARLAITPTSGNTADLIWNGFDGHIYQIETNTDLGSVWQPFGEPFPGFTGQIELSVTLGDPRRFYRLKIVPAS
jgi:hypothetical protein